MMDYQHWPEATGLLSYLKATSKLFSDVGSTPFEILESAGSFVLKKYERPKGQSDQGMENRNPILIIPSFINRSFILDLLPEKSLVKHFQDQGHDVYLIEWGIPSGHEEHLTLDSLFSIYLSFLVERAFQDCEGLRMHLVGHCIGGTVSIILASLFPEYFKSLCLLTAPVNFRGDTKLNRWVTQKNFDLAAFSEAYGNAPWALMQSTFLALKPTQIWSRSSQFFKKCNDGKFLRNFLAMETWINDNVNMRGALLNFVVQELYQENKLISGQLVIAGKEIHLDKLRLPIFVLISDDDHIVPSSSHLNNQWVPFVENFSTVVSQGGHVGALIGGRAQKVMWPQLTSWLRECEGST